MVRKESICEITPQNLRKKYLSKYPPSENIMFPDKISEKLDGFDK